MPEAAVVEAPNPWEQAPPEGWEKHYQNIPSPVDPITPPAPTAPPPPAGALAPRPADQPSPVTNMLRGAVPYAREFGRGLASDVAMFSPGTGQYLSNLLGPADPNLPGSEAARGLGAAAPFAAIEALTGGTATPWLLASGATSPYVGDIIRQAGGGETLARLGETATGILGGGYSTQLPRATRAIGAAILNPLSWSAYAARDLVGHLADASTAKVAAAGAATLAALYPGLRFAGRTLASPVQNIRNFLFPGAGLFGGEAGPAPPVQAAPANAAGGPAPASAPQTQQEQQASRSFFDQLLFDIPRGPHNLLQGPP